MFDSLVALVREQFGDADSIGLHEPTFGKFERQAMLDVIDSGMVSSVGECVGEFERLTAEYTGVAHAVATVNGSSALLSVTEWAAAHIINLPSSVRHVP